MNRPLVLLLLTSCFTSQIVSAQSREEKVLKDREKVISDGFWIYNDLEKGYEEARRTGKPMLVILRCIPCEECVKLDDEMVDRDPVIRPLLEQFVCVRMVSTNGLDLDTFQYDTDQSFAVFMLNADGTIYGRFGTRSHRTEWYSDVSLPGMAKALQGALELHKNYPANKEALKGKRGEPLEYASPEQYPHLKEKYQATIDFTKQGKVVRSCIHCHQIGNARQHYYWDQGKKQPEKLLFPYPHPKMLGLILDPEEKATVDFVQPDSLAAKAGFETGDEIQTLEGQPLLSIADVQWILHHADPDGDALKAKILRNGQTQQLTLTLPDGWRTDGDLSWRVSSWELRRKYFGGMKLEELTDEERRKVSLSPNDSAIRIAHVGRYAPHNFAQRSGFKPEDIILSFDGYDSFENETDLFLHAVNNFDDGEKISVTILRNGKRQTKMLQLP